MRALVIDDSRAMRMMIGRLLTQQGFEILQAGDGQEALDVLGACEPHELPVLCTVDWNMPVMDGLTFVQSARKRTELRDLTLMMVTTESENHQVVRALAAGAHEYLIKPFTAEAMADKLDLLGLDPSRRVA
ncbi:response regulator [Nocardioides bruguierae]|uniref:Response regulator n=1 Tax=Nocardioides bruguierae TaxID=2945102 RepID=A0A9X2IGW3_9ACTN|nr:response regulator [Nocardioides bruguierae]MCL8027655.1 response regulator [Nocardioides bruguierae]MCM0621984.1 response regulator [Nocardioides bruguierae]